MSKVYIIDGIDGSTQPRLVRANNKGQATRYVAKDLLSVRIATVDDVHDLPGVSIEDATTETIEPAAGGA